MIEEVAQEIERRPNFRKTRLALTDGERAFQIRVRKLGIALILDLLHVMDSQAAVYANRRVRWDNGSSSGSDVA